MREFKRNTERERKPAGRFSRDSGSGRDRERFGRDSSESSGRFSSRPEGRFKRDGDRSNRQGPEMHEAVCDKCGRECTVPFKPTSSKPVYCYDCYRKNDNSSAKAGFEPKARPNQSEEELAKINSKLDKIMQALDID